MTHLTLSAQRILDMLCEDISLYYSSEPYQLVQFVDQDGEVIETPRIESFWNLVERNDIGPVEQINRRTMRYDLI